MCKSMRPAIDDRHLDADAWVRALQRSFESPWRRSDAVFHLGAGCDACTESLRELPGRGEALEGRVPAADPVILVLRNWVDVRRFPRKAVDLRPMHRFWIDRSRFAPLDFCRAVVEEGRQLAIDRPDDAISTLASLLGDAVCDDRLLRCCGNGVHDLRGLVHGCLAEAHCGVPDLNAAERHVEEGKRELAMGSGDRELLATLYEHEAALAAVQGVEQPELVYLDAAAGLLRSYPVPGRRAEVLVRKAIALLRRGCGYEAAEVLAEARASLPRDVCPRLLLEVLHHQALADVRNRDFDQALRHLARARELYRIYPLEPMATQRLWIQGVSYLGIDRDDKAEAPLYEALERYCRLREWGGAAHALALLAQLYSSEGRAEELAKLEQRFSRVIRSAPARKLALAGLRQAVRLSTILKVPVPHLRKTLDELAMEEGETSIVN